MRQIVRKVIIPAAGLGVQQVAKEDTCKYGILDVKHTTLKVVDTT